MPDTTMTETETRALAPTGALRVAIAVGPALSPMWATRNATTGKPQGVTIDLGAAMAESLGVPVHYVEHESSGKIVEGASGGHWDVTFIPVDAERKKVLSFGPNYFIGESTYLVAGRTGITKLAEVDRPGIEVTGVEGTATIRSARRTLGQARVRGVTGLQEALTLFGEGKTDAIALGRESLVEYAAQFPGSRVLDEHFHAAGIAVGVPLGNAQALEVAGRLIERFKADGSLRQMFDRNGLAAADIAPAGSQS
jgi:polar amino acid transport system substrate-binding protein